MQTAGTFESRLQLIPPGRFKPETERALRKLTRELDRLARRDEETQEVFIHEPTLRSLLREHTPHRFGERYLRLLKEGPEGHLIRNSRPGKKEKEISLVEAARASGAVAESTPESLGITIDSTLEDVRRIVQPRVLDLPDAAFSPDIARQLREAVDRLDATAESSPSATTAEAPMDYWAKFRYCFGTRAGIWWELGVLMFIWTFFVIWPANPDPVTSIIAALIVAGLFVLAWLLWSLIWCLIASLF